MGFLFLCGFFLNSVVLGFSSVYYNYFNTKLGLNLKSKLIPSLLKRIIFIPYVNLRIFHHGQLLDFLTTDVDRISNFFPSIQEMWSMPLQIIISTILLFQQVGFATFAGIGFIAFLVPLNKILANKIGEFSSSFMHNKDERMKVFTEFLRNIVGIKVGCYENIFFQEISDKRKQELKFLKRQKYLDAFCVIFWAICPVVLCALTFTIYVVLGHTITGTKVLTSLALFNLLIGPMNALPWVINGVIEAMISLKRINTILNYTQMSTKIDSIPYDELSISNCLIQMSNAQFSWNGNDEKNLDTKVLFKNINLEIKENEYIGIIGSVGSGKTSFLMSIMQELNSDGVDSSFRLSQCLRDFSIAYVSQKPWLLKRTIKENIVMFEPYDEIWYKLVIEGCGLDVDFANMQKGDCTEIADHGNSLSGGQKSRISLARAVYHRAKIYLLDDPFSSLDFHVSRLIVERILSNLLMHATVIMTTHNVQYFSKFKDKIRVPDKIYLIENNTLTLSNIEIDKLIMPVDEIMTIDGDLVSQPEFLLNEMDHDRSSENTEHMEIGKIKSNIYFGYVKLVGYFLTSIILSSLLLMQGTKNFSEFWLSSWNSSTNQTNNETKHFNLLLISKVPVLLVTDYRVSMGIHFQYFLKIYLVIVGLNFIFSIIRAFSFAYGGIKASYQIHISLLSVLLRRELTFFETTSRGQILNRFTSDLSTIDDNLPFVVNIFLANVFTCIGSLIIVGLSMPFAIFIVFPVFYFCYFFQYAYRVTSRVIKRLISINRSPLYSHYSEVIEGMVIIRNFRTINKTIEENKGLLLNLIRCDFNGLLLSSWFAMRLQFVGISFVTGVIAIAILAHYMNFMNHNMIGLACVYSLSLCNVLSGVITYATESEKEFIAVERCFEYIVPKSTQGSQIGCEYESDHDVIIATKRSRYRRSSLTSFPSERGSVVFGNVSLRYVPNDLLALSNVNVIINPGQTVGIIGRTGSGKSSLIKLLFRLVSYEKDLINENHLTGYYGQVQINGIDIRNYNLRDLRSCLSTMMQESLIFSGTIRKNLDPNCQYTDDELYAVVTKLEFATYFSGFQNNGLFDLNGHIGNQGLELSLGQHQLLCLGRILLGQNDIICMDEPSAYLDSRTESIIEEVICADFRNKTVLIVGHRLQMLIRVCDSILVMDSGKIVEYGPTAKLLENPNSYLSQNLKR